MRELLIKIQFWFYIKWLFFYKKILHKKRTKTIISNTFLLRLRQIGEVAILLGVIGLLFFVSTQFFRG